MKHLAFLFLIITAVSCQKETPDLKKEITLEKLSVASDRTLFINAYKNSSEYSNIHLSIKSKLNFSTAKYYKNYNSHNIDALMVDFIDNNYYTNRKLVVAKNKTTGVYYTEVSSVSTISSSYLWPYDDETVYDFELFNPQTNASYMKLYF